MIEGERVATLWTATIALPSGREVEVPIFDFFRVEGDSSGKSALISTPLPSKTLLRNFDNVDDSRRISKPGRETDRRSGSGELLAIAAQGGRIGEGV